MTDARTSKELLPCAHCGGAAQLTEVEPMHYVVECSEPRSDSGHDIRSRRNKRRMQALRIELAATHRRRRPGPEECWRVQPRG